MRKYMMSAFETNTQIGYAAISGDHVLIANRLTKLAMVPIIHAERLSVSGLVYDFIAVGVRAMNSVRMEEKSASSGNCANQYMAAPTAPPTSVTRSIVLSETGPSPYLSESKPMHVNEAAYVIGSHRVSRAPTS